MKYVLHAVFFLLGMAAAVAAPAGAAKAGSARAGKAIFAHTCANCHSTRIGVNEVGPSLLGVVGRAPASVPGFVYSDAMKANATPWTPEALDAYLANPRGHRPGVKMWFKGLSSAKARSDVIAYLKTLK